MLQNLRRKLSQDGVHGYLMLNVDPHMSEYVGNKDKRISNISGFTGSNAACFIPGINSSTIDKEDDGVTAGNDERISMLWTDGRYWEQARKELNPNQFKLMKLAPGEITISGFINECMKKGEIIAVDSRLISVSKYKSFASEYGSVEEYPLKLLSFNYVDMVTGSETTTTNKGNPIVLHPAKYTGISAMEKIKKVQNKMKDLSIDYYLVTALDDISWILNLRGSDIPFCPVFYAYLLIPTNQQEGDSVRIFLNKESLSMEALDYLQTNLLIEILNYEDFESFVTKTFHETKAKIVLDPVSTNMRVFNSFPKGSLILKSSFIASMKAVKNQSEIDGSIQAQTHDTIALACYFSWLEEDAKTWDQQRNSITTEYDVAEKLEYFRSRFDSYKGPSFTTISSINENGAIIHYHPEKTTAAKMTRNSVYLCDSGAQYECGTTDVTRTVFIPEKDNDLAPEHVRRCYTRVLQGHVALSQAIFPEKATLPNSLDILARLPLWKDGLDYNHGTGHGVGAAGLVHEFPPSISSRPPNSDAAANPVVLEPGMFVTNEPGYYEFHPSNRLVLEEDTVDKNLSTSNKRQKSSNNTKGFGIRIENMMVVEPRQTLHNFDGKKFLGFSTLTKFPYHRQLIMKELLSLDDIKWIDAYHSQVRSDFFRSLLQDPILVKNFSTSDLERSKAWMMINTEPL